MRQDGWHQRRDARPAHGGAGHGEAHPPGGRHALPYYYL